MRAGACQVFAMNVLDAVQVLTRQKSLVAQLGNHICFSKLMTNVTAVCIPRDH